MENLGTLRRSPTAGSARTYAATVFLGAFLLFALELILGKLALPWFGGSASVWTCCLLFFQTALLAGYGYARKLARAGRQGVVVHGVFLGACLLLLALRAYQWPSSITPDASAKPGGMPGAREVLQLLLLTGGLPFVLLATTSPLLQAWFSRDHQAPPYRLYALSNAGSLLALLLYPAVVEPRLHLVTQGRLWTAMFAVYALGVAACALRQFKTAAAAESPAPAKTAPAGKGLRLRWTGWAMLGSVLLLSTTHRLCEDVASVPLLWVLPLALYLLSFIITFEREGNYRRGGFFGLFALSLVWVSYLLFNAPAPSLSAQLGGYGLALFASCMICHGELYRLRPPPASSSDFYLWTSVGGALGAAAVTLLAPRVFSSFAEYPLALAVLGLGIVATLGRRREGLATAAYAFRLAGAFTTAVLTAILVLASAQTLQGERVSYRNFFGLARVTEQGRSGSANHLYMLQSGNIVHGFQYADERRLQPTSYFTAQSGLGLALTRLRSLRGQGLQVAVLGLGIGSSIALAEPGDRWRFYEINPVMQALAEGSGGYFSYLSTAKAPYSITLGDARISLETALRQGPLEEDLIAIDTFSGDAVPTHLLTEEAISLYLAHLRPGGVIALHLTNRHLDLQRVGFGLAAKAGLTARLLSSPAGGTASSSLWMLLTRESSFFGDGWVVPPQVTELRVSEKPPVLWSDDFNDLWSIRTQH